MAKASLAGDHGSVTGTLPKASDNHLVVIHADESALRGGIGRSDLPIETVKRLTCDCSIVKVVEDHEGTPLDVGRRQRVVSTKLRRALWARDRGCIFPGCRNRIYVQAHHGHHWINGGETDMGNLMLLCTHHHRLVHEGGFTIRREHDDRLTFVRPDGRVIPRAGYRLEDMVDDDIGLDEPGNPSAEGWTRPDTRAPSTEVRELAAVYEIRRCIAKRHDLTPRAASPH